MVRKMAQWVRALKDLASNPQRALKEPGIDICACDPSIENEGQEAETGESQKLSGQPG